MSDSIQNQPDCTGFSPARREQSVRGKTAGSLQRWQHACKSLAGGVSTALRRSARPYPLYFKHGSGASLTDVDGNTYLDYTLGWGPNILGNAPQPVIDSICQHVSQGLTYGAQHDLEFEVADLLTKIIPCADLVCYANSGTEIVQVALRLARSATGRTKYLKFEGHYHGWDDSVLLSYHPTPEKIQAAGNAPIRAPIGEGDGQRPSQDAVIAEWNNIASVETAFAAQGDQISAIICEPLLCNSGCIPAQPGFLQFLRDLCTKHNALLIFDEVITGFRLGLGGAQEYYGVVPDLATYAKAIGGGTALSVLAGKSKFMDLIAEGKVIHAGTLNGNPVALSAAKATLTYLSENRATVYEGLFRRGRALQAGLMQLLTSHGHPVVSLGEGPVFSILFMEQPPKNYRDLLQANKPLYSDLVLALLDEGVLALPDGRWYISAAHTDQDIQATLAAAERAISNRMSN
jgi:glutamate-1-semialdehyde 2,1-aminomutase